MTLPFLHRDTFPISVVHGLDTHGADFYLDLLRDHGFNLLRLPISLAAALDLDSYPRYHFFHDATFRGRTVRQLLQQVIHRAGEQGILVLLDMHRARENEKWELWYTDDYSYADLLRGWNNLMHAYKHEWNVMGGWVAECTPCVLQVPWICIQRRHPYTLSLTTIRFSHGTRFT